MSGYAILQVAVGGAVGAVARHMVALGTTRWLGGDLVVATLAVNIVGSFLMGMAAVAIAHSDIIGYRFSSLVVTGFLGGFTTYSAYALDIWKLIDSARVSAAMLYAGGTVLFAVGALLVGIVVGRLVLT